MKPILLTISLLMSLTLSTATADEKAILGEPLKEKYPFGDVVGGAVKNGEYASGYSYICDMGQAVPDKGKANWYENKPIEGLKLELRARAASTGKTANNLANQSYGFVVITKHGEVLSTFNPLGEYSNNKWKGDTFNAWTNTGTDIEVYNEKMGTKGHAEFDLLAGMGFYFKSKGQGSPSYFLSGCKRINKQGLPVYWYDFQGN
jgi:hypothetical protein